MTADVSAMTMESESSLKVKMARGLPRGESFTRMDLRREADAEEFRAPASNASKANANESTRPAGRACWVCNGSGNHSSWLNSGFEDNSMTDLTCVRVEEPQQECPICFSSPGRYGVSTECHHLFCEDCIPHVLRAILESGQFPGKAGLVRSSPSPF